MSVYATKAFWAGTAERGIKVFASSLLGVIGTGTLGIHEFDWLGALAIAATALVVSILTSVSQPDFTAGEADATPVPADYQPQHRAHPDGPHGS